MVSRILPLRPFKEDFARRSQQVEFWTDRGGHGARMDYLGFEAYARSGRSKGESRTHLSANFVFTDCTSCQPRLWTEVQAGIECLTQLLLLIDTMACAQISDKMLSEGADLLQQQLVYNGEILDIALDSLRSYKEGVQSLTFLDSAIHLAYSLLRMLERWGKTKGEELYVRKKAKRKKKTGRCFSFCLSTQKPIATIRQAG